MKFIKKIKALIASFSAFLFLLSCSQNPQTVNQKNQSLDKNYTLTIVDQYTENKEWNAYKESIGMFALHLKPSENILNKKYEFKYEWYSDGEKKGELVFNTDKLGYIKGGVQDDSMLHYYAFPKLDTAFVFNFSYVGGQSGSILLPLDFKIRDLYKWINLSQDNKSFQLKDSVWMPIATLTQPYIEACTPEKCYYCVLPENVHHYQDWGKTMGIKQYFIFSIRIL